MMRTFPVSGKRAVSTAGWQPTRRRAAVKKKQLLLTFQTFSPPLKTYLADSLARPYLRHNLHLKHMRLRVINQLFLFVLFAIPTVFTRQKED
jgi:hypothetical protein